MKNEIITLDQARKVLEVVDAGLCGGIGNPVPGQMCVEAAVCYALGQPHGDEPECVNDAVRRFKIKLNDSPWSSNEARAAGMRRLAIAQLGTSDPSFNEAKFIEVLVEQTIRKIVPHALRAAVKTAKDERKASLEEAALRCERDGDLGAARNAREAADIVYAAATTAYAASSAAATTAYAASSAASAADYADSYAAKTAAATTAYAATAASAADYADSYAAYAAFYAAYASAADDIALNMSADIGVQALRAAGAHGIALMDQLIPSP
jgi:hypothetical protein